MVCRGKGLGQEEGNDSPPEVEHSTKRTFEIINASFLVKSPYSVQLCANLVNSNRREDINMHEGNFHPSFFSSVFRAEKSALDYQAKFLINSAVFIPLVYRS